MSRLPTPSRPERPYSASRIRGESDGGSLPRVDRGTQERVDPTVPLGPPGQGGEIRVPDPPRAPRPVERVLRADGGARDLGRDDGRRRARLGGRPMTAPDEYLGQVRRAMAGMEPKVRDDILLELRSHIAESAAANGGNVNASLAAVGTPEDVG